MGRLFRRPGNQGRRHRRTASLQAIRSRPAQPHRSRPPSATDDGLLIDNGLWTDASVGQCCPACGGGNGPPADWYTLQGVRVISRTLPGGSPLRLKPLREAPTRQCLILRLAITTWKIRSARSSPTTRTIRQSVTGPNEVLNSRQFGLGVAAGYDMTIGHYFCRDKNNNDHFVEFTFWGLNSWSKAKTVGGYVVPVYDQSSVYTSPGHPDQLGRTGPSDNTGEFQGSLRTNFPIAGSTEFPGATRRAEDAQPGLQLRNRADLRVPLDDERFRAERPLQSSRRARSPGLAPRRPVAARMSAGHVHFVSVRAEVHADRRDLHVP